jgi:PAS domain S-box-containing protein
VIGYWNTQAERIFGWSREEAIGRSMAETIVPPRYRDAHKHGLKKLFDTGAGPMSKTRIEIHALHRDGREFPVELTIAPANLTGVWTFTAFIRDNSERERAQEELLKAKEAAGFASRSKSEFLANIGHETRTTINAILGMTDLILDTELTRNQREYLNIIQASAESLLKTINDILDFSEIEAGNVKLEVIEFDLRDSISATIHALAPSAAQKGLQLVCHVQSNVPHKLLGDPGRLRQILTNLISNAIKFTERGEVRVEVKRLSTAPETTSLHFSISDTGIGIPPEKQEFIFEPFTQAETSSVEKFGGTGLGLAIASQLVEIMEGRISVESEVGKGSTFHLTARFGVPR